MGSTKVLTVVRDLLLLSDLETRAEQHFTAAITQFTADENLAIELIDVIWLLDLQNQNAENKKKRDALVAFTKFLLSKEIITKEKCLERLEPEILEEIGAVDSQVVFKKKLVQQNTRLFYKQQRFNLFREENEGYSKLISELTDWITSNPDDKSAEGVLENVQSLIGYFELDPSKVLDVILQCFESHTDKHTHFVNLIKLFNPTPSTVANILGFRFQHYQKPEATDLPGPGLYLVTAYIIQAEIFRLEDVLPHLSPSDSELETTFADMMKEAAAKAKKFTTVSLSGKTEEPAAEIVDIPTLFLKNQKLGLVDALLVIQDLPHGLKLLQRMPKFFATSFPSVLSSLFRYCHASIEPIYRRVSPRASIHGGKGRQPLPESSPVPLCHTFDDVVTNLFPIFSQVGHFLSKDIILFTKLSRVCFGHISTTKGKELEQNLQNWSRIIGDTILPACSLIPSNPAVLMEIWHFISLFPFQLRFKLYSTWKNVAYESAPDMIIANVSSISEAKKILRRVTKDTDKKMWRQLAKIAHSNPLSFFQIVMEQLQSYDNLIQPVVDALKYLTPLGFDVLCCTMIDYLANPNKQRLKPDGTNISSWLQGLSLFAGAVCKKYPEMEIVGILSYISSQLRGGNSLDLVVLKELVQKMSGIETLEDMSEAQYEALAGGETLRLEGGSFNQIRNVKKSSSRLIGALVESNLAVIICILIAQHRVSISFDPHFEHLKLIGGLFDQCTEAIIQYLEFLTSNLEPKDFDRLIPSVDELCSTYNLEPSVAFLIARPKITFRIKEAQEPGKQAAKGWNTALSEISNAIQPILPQEIWKGISPQFFVTFWQLSLFDIFVPTERYKEQIAKQERIIQELNDQKDQAPDARKKREKEKERCQGVIERLNAELVAQNRNHEETLRRIAYEKERWFEQSSNVVAATNNLFQYCIYPRCLMSAADASFCAKFIHLMHKQGTANFSSLGFFDRLFSNVAGIIFTLTEKEATFFGRFLNEILALLSRWHSDKAIYEKEAIGNELPGFRRKWSEKNLLNYEDFRRVSFKWHLKVSGSFAACLASKEYMQIRNSLLILTRVKENFPVLRKMATTIRNHLLKLKDDEREDLKMMSTRYQQMLSNMEGTWISEEDFYIKNVEDEKAKTLGPPAKKEAPLASSTQTKKPTESDKKTPASEGRRGSESSDSSKISRTSSKTEDSRTERAERSERSERSERADRPDRSEREKSDKPADKGGKSDRNDRNNNEPEKTPRAEKTRGQEEPPAKAGTKRSAEPAESESKKNKGQKDVSDLDIQFPDRDGGKRKREDDDSSKPGTPKERDRDREVRDRDREEKKPEPKREDPTPKKEEPRREEPPPKKVRITRANEKEDEGKKDDRRDEAKKDDRRDEGKKEDRRDEGRKDDRRDDRRGESTGNNPKKEEKRGDDRRVERKDDKRDGRR